MPIEVWLVFGQKMKCFWGDMLHRMSGTGGMVNEVKMNGFQTESEKYDTEDSFGVVWLFTIECLISV